MSWNRKKRGLFQLGCWGTQVNEDKKRKSDETNNIVAFQRSLHYFTHNFFDLEHFITAYS